MGLKIFFFILGLCLLFLFLFLIRKIFLVQKKLEKEKRELETIIDTVPAIIVHKDLSGKILKVNRLVRLLTRDLCPDLIGIRPTDLFPELKERIEREDFEVISTQKPLLNLTYTFLDEKGERRWLSAHRAPYLGEDGLAIGTIFLAQEITEQKKFEEEIRTQKELYQFAIQGTREGLWDWPDIDQDRQYWSPRMKELLGYEDEEIEGSHQLFFSLLHPDDRPRLEEAKKLHLEENKPYSVEIRLKKKSGEWAWFETKGQIVADNGKLRMSGLLADISLRKKAEESAEIAHLAKSEFLSNVSHEIRTPLNGLVGMTELLSTTDLSSDQIRYVKTIHSSAELLASIINDILDLSKIEAGHLHLEKKVINLEEVTGEVVQILDAEANQKSVELITRHVTDLPIKIVGDPVRLKQLLLNLLSNAIKFSQGGKVILLVETKDQKIRFSVTDTGIGIEEGKIPLIFEKFSQVDASITRRFGGTGLGLSISKKLVEMMGGRIGVESVFGEGSTFWFEIPYFSAIETEEPSKLSEKIKESKILIVDDYPENLETLSLYLNKLGIQDISLAISGEEALRLLHQSKGKRPFDVALIDYAMPQMDGKVLGDLIKSDGSFNSLKMLLVTGVAKLEQTDSLKDHGFSGVLFKPIFLSDLAIGLKQLFGKAP